MSFVPSLHILSRRDRQWLRVAAIVLALAAAALPFNAPRCQNRPAPAGPSEAKGQLEPGSGIRGAIVAAWGNAPADPPTYECVKVFDLSGQKLIATGTCSGIWGSFSVALPPGRYLVDKEGSRTMVNVGPGQWVGMFPKPLPGPVP